MTPQTIRGEFDYHIRLGKEHMAQVTGNFTIHVNPAAQPLAETPNSGALPAETVGVPVKDAVTVLSGGTPPYKLDPATSGLPPGVTAALDPDGVTVRLGGTPTAAGDANVAIVADDSGA